MPLAINGNLDIDNSNVFHNPSDATEVNTHNGIYIFNMDVRVTGARSWGETEVPLVILGVDGGDLKMDAESSRTLAEGVIVKRLGDAIRYSGTNLHGHDQSNVWFTSYYDDTKGGDTDGNGSTITPSHDDWRGVYNSSSVEFENWSNILYSKN